MICAAILRCFTIKFVSLEAILGRRFQEHDGDKMNLPVAKKAKEVARALLIIGALLTLCISEGVGLQLLPPPASAATRAAGAATPETQIASCAQPPAPPAPEKSVISRVEIVAPKLKKLAFASPLSPLAAPLPVSRALFAERLPLAASLPPPPSLYVFRPAGEPTSRAPPCLA